MPMQLESLADLYLEDETAWLDNMARLLREGDRDALDLQNLSEYLSDMAKRDRREVESRLAVLIAHLLKWRHLSDRRTGSWHATIEVQRHELGLLLDSKTLRNHAEASLESAYDAAVREASAETELPISTFPTECPFALAQIEDADFLPE